MSRTPTLLGLPYDASSSFLRGPAAAPQLIRKQLWSEATNPWSEALIDISVAGALADAGDLELPPDSTGARERIQAGVAAVYAAGGRAIALGGDHSVSFPVLRAVGPRFPELTLVHVDAHPDLNDIFEGDRFSHACPFARILEEGLVARLVQIGIRTMSGHQRAQADRFGVEVIDMRAWEEGRRPALGGPVYLSLDLDGIDPAFAPGVSHQEPGGLTVRDVISLIQRLPGPIVGADVVEYNPLCDVGGTTARVAAKLVKEIVGRMLATGAAAPDR
ncbi:MAG: agmatinase [Thermoanaerobaculia bacterium]|nr:agmatinase [Thermoanaerobaculia bacterium]MBP9823210.1 agmatinase [Thermoanaerobaculia bacterium]